jgi:hypothetical protein
VIERTRLVAMATAGALACLPTAARADATTGNDLWSKCTSKDGVFDRAICDGYVAAISEAMGPPNGVYDFRACFPERSTRGQLVDVVKQYLDRHPEQRHLPAVTLVANALATAFPCKQ